MRALIPLVLALAGPLFVSSVSAQAGASTPTAVLVSGPDVGRRAPDFTLPWAGKDGPGPADSPYQLWRDRGKTVVLAFYPRDFTSSGTTQMREFGQRYDSLFGPEVVLVAISSDSVETHGRFASSLNLPFRLLSDPEQRVARKYGSYDSSGFPRRTVFVIGPDGRVKYRNLDFNAQDPKDYAALGRAVRSSRGG
ncbi:MAG TPA: redoxin domain-containing protein [Gemmatimonadales bacterium]|jgi:peroxiredoxin Q/BCP